MKLKLSQIVNNTELLTNLSEMKLAPKKSFQLGMLLVEIDAIVKEYQKSLLTVFKELGEEKGEQYVISLENQDKFNEQLQILLDEEVNVRDVSISPDDVKEDISAKYFVNLNWLFKE